MKKRADAGEWFVLLPLLTRRRGAVLVALSRLLGIEKQAELVSRDQMFQLTMDVQSAQYLRDALAGHVDSPQHESMRLALIEDLEQFTNQAEARSDPDS